jgi:tRNA (mo5U34)-methyltransferase
MKQLRDAVRRQLGTDRPSSGDFDPAALVRFSPNLAEQLSREEWTRFSSEADELEPWLQGPFLLGGDLVVGGAWRNDLRWANLDSEIPEDLRGTRVLDVGSNAGYDPFMFNLRGADYVLGCEPFEFIQQAHFLESIFQTGVDFQQIGWQDLSPERHGTFELVHCHGVLYHEVNPILLLERLHQMTAPGGTLLLGSMMLAEPEFAEMARFVPGAYYGDETWWWVPGPEALRSMTESVGFDVEKMFGEAPGPPGEFPTINGYFEARRESR